MKLKILVAPLAVAAATAAVIWIIAPQFMAVREKLKELDERNEKLDQIKEKNVQAEKLGQDLQGSSEKRETVMKFVSQFKKEEEIIDNLNYYTSQGGLALYSLNISQPKKAPVEEEVSMRSFFAAAGSKNEGKKEAPKDLSVPQNLEVEIGVSGTYERIKEFFAGISKLARYNSIASLQISAAPEKDASEGEKTENDLQANAVLVFNYLEKSDSAVINADNGIFSNEKFDMSVADEIRQKMDTSMFKLELDKTGRDNPFLPSK